MATLVLSRTLSSNARYTLVGEQAPTSDVALTADACRQTSGEGMLAEHAVSRAPSRRASFLTALLRSLAAVSM